MERKDLVPSLFGTGRGGDVFSALQNEVGRVFDSFMRHPSVFGRDNGFAPLLEVSESANGIDIAVELPGCDPKDIEVSVVGRTLALRGEKRIESETKEKDWHVSERSYGSFVRTVPLPFAIDAGKVEATFDKGVLKLHVPRPAESMPERTRVEIKSAP